MSTITTPPRPDTTPAPSAPTRFGVTMGDQRIAIRDVSWEIYDLLSDAVGERQHVYLAYDGKDLERAEEIRRWVIEEDIFSDELAWEERLRAWARAELMPRQTAG